jgi:hypothetical protein
MAMAAGDLPTAKDHYQACQDITERLAAADPANTRWQHGLAIGHIKLGEVAIADGDPTAARGHCPRDLRSAIDASRVSPTSGIWMP